MRKGWRGREGGEGVPDREDRGRGLEGTESLMSSVWSTERGEKVGGVEIRVLGK